MKYIFILSLFLTSTFLFSQEYIKNDSLDVSNVSYATIHMSFDKSSLHKSFVVFSIEPVDIESTKVKIIECFKENKLEHTEIYLIAIPKNEANKNQIIEVFLLKIDYDRMKNNLFTVLIPCSSDLNFNFKYHQDQQRKKVSEFNYLFQLDEKDTACQFLKK